MKHKIIKIITLFTGIVLLYIHYKTIYPWMLDDGFISFRYAQNFANGDGLIFNPGSEHVEGYTNFLWIIILTVGKIIGFDIVVLSKILGYIFSIGTILLILFFFGNGKQNFVRSILSAILLISNGAFTVWGSSGMETSFFTFLVTFSILIFRDIIKSVTVKKLFLLGVIVSLQALTRPEGYIFFVIFLLLIFFKYFPFHNFKKGKINILKLLSFSLKKPKITQIVIFISPYLIFTTFHFIFRYLYYHDFLPNTFYNKVGLGIYQYLRGLRYIKQFITSNLILIIILFIGFVLKFKNFKMEKIEENFFNLSLYFFITIYTIYIIFVGGDVMPGHRFFAPILPAITILSASSIILISRKIQTKNFIVLMSSIFFLFNLAQWQYDIKLNEHLKGDVVAENGKEVGIWLKENFPKDTVIATNTAGTIPFYSEFKTIDMLGLNDKHIAKRKMPSMGKGFPGHEKTDGNYILSQDPDIIQFGSSLGSKEPVLISDLEISQNEKFWENYHLQEYTLPSGKTLYLYVKTIHNQNNNH